MRDDTDSHAPVRLKLSPHPALEPTKKAPNAVLRAGLAISMFRTTYRRAIFRLCPSSAPSAAAADGHSPFVTRPSRPEGSKDILAVVLQTGGS